MGRIRKKQVDTDRKIDRNSQKQIEIDRNEPKQAAIYRNIQKQTEKFRHRQKIKTKIRQKFTEIADIDISRQKQTTMDRNSQKQI